ncbi:MAG: mandelate racemase/muconate lactonizing enzyme family protein [bacterium]|nr:MAG: mandelate racemase/muconate lactonizing enzyme family protein [bacterium]
MKIVKVETFTRPKVGVVRIQTDDGSVGYGQISPHDAEFSTLILHKKIAKHFLGEDPAHIDALVDDCIESNYKYPWTYVCRALTGLDTAIWDLYGQIKNKPVVELLGGRVRGISAYGSSMRRDITPEDEASRMIALRDSKGFKAFKLRIGKKTGHDQDQWPGRTEKLVPTVRKALGDNIDLLADANSGYTPPRAIAIGRILEDNNVFFFEEPCPYWELEWTAEVANKLNVSVAGGEQDNDLAQWRRMINMNVVDIVQPDVCYIGGLTRALRVARMAQKAGKLCVPHTSNVSMVSVFSLHMLGAIPNNKYLEFTIDGTSELANESRAMYEPQLAVVDGKVMIPDGPGWGVTFNKEWLESAEYQKSELQI